MPAGTGGLGEGGRGGYWGAFWGGGMWCRRGCMGCCDHLNQWSSIGTPLCHLSRVSAAVSWRAVMYARRGIGGPSIHASEIASSKAHVKAILMSCFNLDRPP